MGPAPTRTTLTLPPPDSHPAPSPQKLPDPSDVLGPSSSKEVEMIHLEIPAHFGAPHCSIDEMLPHMDKFLFPASDATIKKLDAFDVLTEVAMGMIREVQGVLSVRNHFEHLHCHLVEISKQEEINTKKIADMQQNLDNVNKIKDELISELTSLRERVASFEKEKTSWEEEKRLLNEKVRQLSNESTDRKEWVAAYYTFKTRRDLMVEYMEGKADEWDPQEAIRVWDEDFAEKTPPLVEEEAPQDVADDATSQARTEGVVAEQVADAQKDNL